MWMFRRNDDMVYRQEGIERFVEAQKRDYKTALSEIRAGHKETHWIWYVFPQLYGLGRSCYSNLYGIVDKKEATEYLNHRILGKRLRDATEALLGVKGKTAEEIFGGLDAMKVKSCMTLFDRISPDDIFAEVLDAYYGGARCEKTLELLGTPAADSESADF